MKSLTVCASVLALAAMSFAQMSGPADARSRGKAASSKMGTMSKSPQAGANNTGGLNSSPSAAGGNAGQPTRSGSTGSGGGAGGAGQ